MYLGESSVMLSMILVTFSAFILSAVLVPLAKIVAKKFNILDVPDGKIKKHAVATPYLGGVAVYLGFLVPVLFILPYNLANILLLCGATLVLVVGLIDDIWVFKPGQKFIGQSVAVLFFLSGGFYLHIGCCPWLGILISALWILTVINAFNLIDVMDGLATSTACSVACGFALIALYLHQYSIAAIFLCLAGSLAGFLLYNWPQASIYLGDAGSLFIGGLLGTLPLSLNLGVNCHYGYLAPAILLAIPLLELVSLIVIRMYKKIPFYQGSPDHFSIYLQKHGWFKKNILFYVFIMMFMLIAAAYGLVAGILNIHQIVFLALIFLFIWFTFLIWGWFWPYKKQS